MDNNYNSFWAGLEAESNRRTSAEMQRIARDWTSELENIPCLDEDSGCQASMSDYPEEHDEDCRYHAKEGDPDYDKKAAEAHEDGLQNYQESFVE